VKSKVFVIVQEFKGSKGEKIAYFETLKHGRLSIRKAYLTQWHDKWP